MIKFRLLGLLFAIFTMLLFSGCEGEKKPEVQEVKRAEASPAVAEKKVIVALGDSLTAGLGVAYEEAYPALLQAKLQKDKYDYRVVNSGVSGETSSGTLSRLNWILSQKPNIVILEIGANDGLRGIDTQLVEKNIDQIVQKLKDNGVVTILAGMKMVRNLGEGYTGKFNAIYPRIAAQHDLIFMPFFLQDVAGVPELNNADGIHPNAQGYQVITENIYPYVLRAIE